MSAPSTTPRAEVVALRWHPALAFPARLRMVRKEHGIRTGRPKLTQVEFANELSVNPNTYKQWESGHSRPADLITFAKTAHKATGCDPAWLLDVATDETPSPTDGGSGQAINESACTRSPQVIALRSPSVDRDVPASRVAA